MSSTESGGWLREYIDQGSNEAFGKLVAGHFDLVYSAAWRRCGGDAHLAQDVAQKVFTDLARMAKSLPRGVYLAGWLYRHTGFTAAKAVRGERRRQKRERHAMEMKAQNEATENDGIWLQLAPVLEEGMKELGTADRDAILLRYFERQSFRVVGDVLGTSEDGARKRVERALEKLRGYFGSRGVTVSAVALGEVLNAQAVSMAPVGAAGMVVTAALAGAATGGGVASVFQFIVMTKLQIAGVVIAAGLAVAVVQQALTNGKLREENRALAQQLAQMDDLRAENERLAKAQTNAGGALDEEQLNDLLRLRGQVSGLKGQLAEAQQLVERSEKAAKLAAMKSALDPTEQQVAIAKMSFIQQSVVAAMMFAQDNKGQFPTNFEQIAVYGKTNYSKDNIDLDASQFELVYHGTLLDATNATGTIAIREKEPVQNAAGGWIRAYGFLDGHSEVHKGPDDGNFEPWESEHMQRAVGQ